ncbi:hypothetical protein EV361DRAFT_895224 [Lentinula raphanica]|nr:hypothetical protein EV361DRAFT_895224 [Lentinula raphanica]
MVVLSIRNHSPHQMPSFRGHFVYERELTEAEVEWRYQEFLRDPRHQPLINQWISLACWEGPRSFFEHAFYILSQTDPSKLSFYDNSIEQNLETAMTLREMALMYDIGWDLLDPGTSLQGNSRELLQEASDGREVSGSLHSSNSSLSIRALEDSSLLFDRTRLAGPRDASQFVPQIATYTTTKSPFAYLEWHKEIDRGITNGDAALGLRSLVNLSAGRPGPSGDDLAGSSTGGGWSNNVEGVIASEGSSLTQGSGNLKYGKGLIKTDPACESSKGNAGGNKRATSYVRAKPAQKEHSSPVNRRNRNVAIEPLSENSQNGAKSPPVTPTTSPRSTSLSDVTNQSPQRVLEVQENMEGPAKMTASSVRPLTIRIPPRSQFSNDRPAVISDVVANISVQPSSPLTPLHSETSLTDESPNPERSASLTVGAAPRRSLRIAANRIKKTAGTGG